MLEGGGSFKDTRQNTDVPESKPTALDKLQNGLEKIAVKVSEIFTDDYMDETDSDTADSFENDKDVKPNDLHEEEYPDSDNSVKALFERLFSDDFPDTLVQSKEANEKDDKESDVEKRDPFVEKISQNIGAPEEIEELIDKHPEKAELWRSQLEALETLNDPEASPAEIRSAQAKLSSLKGQILEVAVKDALADLGFDVEDKQRLVDGENGGTRPDVIGVNNTDSPIGVFDGTLQPGETISVECKCGSNAYITNQLKNHIPNQLSGQEGTKVLLTTSDIMGAPDGLASDVCNRYNAKLVILDVSVSDVEKAIKEVTGE